MPFKMDQKLTIKFWLLLYENLLPRSLKNRPIWSHCCHAMAVFIHAMEHFISGAQLDKLISPLKLQSGLFSLGGCVKLTYEIVGIYAFIVPTSVTRFGKISPLWQILASLWILFEGLFCIGQKF